MASAESPVVVLLPIKPRYARPIMSGKKLVEFRKNAFARRPSHVVVYASTPVRKVLGYFEVSAVDVDAVDALWDKYSHVGGVPAAEFGRYYAGRERGVAVSVGRIVHAATPAALADLGLDGRPPQNYAYVDSEVLDRVLCHSDSSERVAREDRRDNGRCSAPATHGLGCATADL